MTRLRSLLPGMLLIVLAAEVLPAAWAKSPTSDEFAHHLASGFSHLVKHDFRMNPAMPPLPRMLTAVPMWLMGAKGPWGDPSWESGNSPEFARAFFYKANAGLSFDRLIFWARFPILLASMAFALLVFWWASRLAGYGAGLAAMALYVFCPDILAHSALATSDLCVAFFFFAAIVGYERFLRAPGMKGAGGVAAATGAAFLSKFTTLLLGPIFVLIAATAGRLSALKPRWIATFTVGCILTIWAGYFFEVKPLLEHTPDPAKKTAFLEKVGGSRLVELASVPLPLTTFTASLGSMVFTRAKGTNAFLLGKWSTSGWWYYYFTAFLVKNTIPFLLLIAIALALAGRLPLDRLAWSALAVPIVFFFIITMPDRAQAGIRYFLPIYPLFFVICGAAASWIWKTTPKARWVVAALLIWHAAEAVCIAPSYLAYFNEAVGGPRNGYKILRDSNIDWGQDLKGLGEFQKQNNIPEVVLFYYGSVDPKSYGIRSRDPQADEFEHPRKAVYALAVHHIDSMKWFENYKPVKKIGYSIYVYDLR